MKKILVSLVTLVTTLIPAHADEGMWTLYNLPNAVYEQMKGYGYSLPYEKLYQADDAIMHAVVNFSGYCSGVVVSPDVAKQGYVCELHGGAEGYHRYPDGPWL